MYCFAARQLGSEEFSLVSGAYGHSQMESTKKLIDAADSVLVAPYVYRPVGSASIADILARLAHASNAHTVTFRAHDSVASIEVRVVLAMCLPCLLLPLPLHCVSAHA